MTTHDNADSGKLVTAREAASRDAAKRAVLDNAAALVTPEQMAAILGRDVLWVRRHRRILPVIQLGKLLFRIMKEDIPTWEEFSERAARGEQPFDATTGRQDTTGYVYFIQATTGGPIKIGKADDVNVRLAALQLACPFRLRVLAKRPGGYLLERELHHRFRAYRLHGEWFREDAPGLREAMREPKRASA